jgi:hypothetical protein
MELKSLTQRIKCVGAESGCFRILRECLGDSFMRLGVPFIATRQLGAVEDNLGRLILPSVVWTVTVAVQCMIAFQNRCSRPLQLRSRWRSGHCPVPPADRWCGPRIARGLRGRPLRWRPLAHRTVR